MNTAVYGRALAFAQCPCLDAYSFRSTLYFICTSVSPPPLSLRYLSIRFMAVALLRTCISRTTLIYGDSSPDFILYELLRTGGPDRVTGIYVSIISETGQVRWWGYYSIGRWFCCVLIGCWCVMPAGTIFLVLVRKCGQDCSSDITRICGCNRRSFFEIVVKVSDIW